MQGTRVGQLVSEFFAVVWFAAAIGGGLLVVVAAFAPRDRRRFPLLAAGVCFAIAGLLGILSIGILFVALSAVCFVFSERAHRRSASPPSSA